MSLNIAFSSFEMKKFLCGRKCSFLKIRSVSCCARKLNSSSYSFRRLLQKHQRLKNQFQLTVSTSHPMFNNHQKTKKLISWGNLKSSAKVYRQFVKMKAEEHQWRSASHFQFFSKADQFHICGPVVQWCTTRRSVMVRISDNSSCWK